MQTEQDRKVQNNDLSNVSVLK